MKFYTLVAIALFIASLSSFGQIKKNSLTLPEIKGYHLLKCDFHMHTVFSDGMVWPTVRVNEAVKEGLDAIAITDHVEYRPKLQDFTSKDHERSFQVAQKTASEYGVILIKGTEITRRMAPGHFNAIFLNDANIFESFVDTADTRNGANIIETLQEAVNQGAYVFWNHPWFQHPENKSEWQPIHEELFQKGLIKGIEVVNGVRYDSLVYRWCLDKKLGVIATSDVHAPMTLQQGEYRAMTLVFAKERSEKGIREALLHNRTVAYSKNFLYGEEQWVKPIVEKSLKVKMKPINARLVALEIENTSGISYKMEVVANKGVTVRLNSDMNTFSLDAHSETIIPVASTAFEKGKEYSFKVKVNNVLIAPDKALEYTFNIKI